MKKQRKQTTESIGDGLGFEYYEEYVERYNQMSKEQLIRELAAMHCYLNFLIQCTKDTDERVGKLEASLQKKDPINALQEWYNKA